MQNTELTEFELTDQALEAIHGGCQGTTLGVVQLGGNFHLGGGYGYGFGTPVVVEPQTPPVVLVPQTPVVVQPQTCQPQVTALPPTLQCGQTLTLV